MIKKIYILNMAFFLALALGATSAYAVSITWEAGSGGPASEYWIYYGLDKTSLKYLDKVSSSTKTYSLNSVSLDSLKTYYFGIKAHNDAGESGLSEIKSYVPGDETPPIPLSNLKGNVVDL